MRGTFYRFALAALVLAHANPAETVPELPHRVELVLERSGKDGWTPADPRTVFRPGEEVRFQFKSTYSGYLYVLDLTAKGDYMWLFPTAQTGMDNHIRPGVRYLIPATSGVLVIPDTPGIDTTYWVLSPVELTNLWLPLKEARRRPNTLLPRCRPAELKARGACLDDNAGPKPVAQPDSLPAPLAGTNALTARQLSVAKDAESSHIQFIGANGQTLIYEFWIAHR
jgi:hypothetical protein